MIRVVADTNLYISALTFGGVADEVLALGRGGVIALCISSPVLEEIKQVLAADKFKWSTEQIRAAIASIQRYARLVRPQATVTRLKGNDPDNRILECALEAGALFLVTGDHHLQQVKKFRGIAIVSPREFLDARPWV